MKQIGRTKQALIREWSGFLSGILFSLTGLFVVKANTLFGTVLTMYAVVFTIIQARQLFLGNDQGKLKEESQNSLDSKESIDYKLETLKRLLDKGLITEQEYQKKKVELLNQL